MKKPITKWALAIAGISLLAAFAACNEKKTAGGEAQVTPSASAPRLGVGEPPKTDPKASSQAPKPAELSAKAQAEKEITKENYLEALKKIEEDIARTELPLRGQ
jgi:hypothetical protein